MQRSTYWDRHPWPSGFHRRTPRHAGTAPFHPRTHQFCPGLSLWTGMIGRAEKKTERNNIWGPLVATSCVTNQTRPNQKDICLNWKQYVSRELRLLPVWASIRLYPWSTAPSDPFWTLLHWPDARAPSLPRCSPQRSTHIDTCTQQTVKQGFSIATCIQYGLIGAGSYCGDFIKWAPVGVASKGSIVGDLGITFAVARWTWDTHFPLFPNWKQACEGNNRTQCCSKKLWYTTNSDLWEHLW